MYISLARARARERERERLSKNVFPPLYNNLPWRSRFFRFILLLQAGTRLFIPRFELLLFFVFGRHRLIFFQGPPASALPRPQLSFRSLLFFFSCSLRIYINEPFQAVVLHCSAKLLRIALLFFPTSTVPIHSWFFPNFPPQL